MVAYSAVGDLLLGSIPLPSYIDPTKVIQDASDEIDSKLGHIFVTPFNLTTFGVNQLSRPAALLIKRINNSLASGRLLLAIASSEENSNVHAYGWSLIKEANDALYSICEGVVQLEGSAPNPEAPVAAATTPLINNLDAVSAVEAFYDFYNSNNPPTVPYARRYWQG